MRGGHVSQPQQTQDERFEVRALVHGEVQGVGFRFFVRREASLLGLTGWVRNMPEGTVEFVAQGRRMQLDRLVDAARHGPSGARVADVAVEWHNPTSTLAGFSIRR